MLRFYYFHVLICALHKSNVLDYHISHACLDYPPSHLHCHCLEFTSRIYVHLFTQRICAFVRIDRYGWRSCRTRNRYLISDVECALFVCSAKSNSVSACVIFRPAHAIFGINRGKLYSIDPIHGACHIEKFHFTIYHLRWSRVNIIGTCTSSN